MTKLKKHNLTKCRNVNDLFGNTNENIWKNLGEKTPWWSEAGVAEVDDTVSIHVGGSNLNHAIIFLRRWWVWSSYYDYSDDDDDNGEAMMMAMTINDDDGIWW